jgi:hypothetical protein
MYRSTVDDAPVAANLAIVLGFNFPLSLLLLPTKADPVPIILGTLALSGGCAVSLLIPLRDSNDGPHCDADAVIAENASIKYGRIPARCQ